MVLQRAVPGPINPKVTSEADTHNFVRYHEGPDEHTDYLGDKDVFKDF